MRDLSGDTLREASCVGGLIGALWFACYLYEIGFLARFGVPATLAEVGFSRPFALILAAGPPAALAAALLLPKSAATRTGFAALSGLLALAIAAAAAMVGRPGLVLLGGGIGLPTHPAALILYGCMIFYAGLLFAHWQRSVARGGRGGVVQASLIILLLTLVPVGLGWSGGESKMENRRSFLHLTDRPDFVLVRLYDDKAVFVRYDRETGRFGREWMIHRLDNPNDAYLRLAAR